MDHTAQSLLHLWSKSAWPIFRVLLLVTGNFLGVSLWNQSITCKPHQLFEKSLKLSGSSDSGEFYLKSRKRRSQEARKKASQFFPIS